MSGLWFSRVRLRSGPDVAALAAALMPAGEPSLGSDHRLMWTLFPGPDETRDFLWRRAGAAPAWLLLSRRRPVAQTPLLRVESKAFEPSLASGDRLAFDLRLNATVARKDGGGRGQRHDVAMDLLRHVPPGERAGERMDLAERAARDWLAAHADGFRLDALALEGYRRERLPRRGRDAAFGVFDTAGRLTVTDPARFLSRLAQGFGRARAFGCGLMLIRRAP